MKTNLSYVASLVLAGSLCLTAASPVLAQDKPVKEADKINKKRNKLLAKETGLSKDQLNYDAQFVTAAASSNILESALGQLAQKKAIATEVQEWGRQMDQTHGQAQRELQEIADRAHVTLPVSMSKDDKALYDDVDDRKYLGFDKKYLRSLKSLHERVLKEYSEAATKLTNPELRQYAARMLPVLRQDEQTIDQLFERANDRK
jgi:putative membrane protein